MTRPRLPVLLVPGWSDRARKLRFLQAALHDAGWSSGWVHAVDFRDRYGSNVEHATEIAAAAEHLAQRTAQTKLDIVAFSMGGLAARRYLLDGGACNARRAIFLGTPHRGTLASYVAWGRGRTEMMPGSEFLRALDNASCDDVEIFTLRAQYDFRIFPNSSALLDPATDEVVPLCTHRGLIRQRAAFERIIRLLTR